MSLGPPEDPTLRTTFDAVAEAYDGVRPPLPEDLIDDVVELAHLPARGRVLEIGCGTGSATVAFAERGYEVVAVELGDGLATVARRNLAPFPNARVDTAAFEQWRLPDERFDLVTAFHAWHWLDPAVALDKAARALRPAGALAIVGGTHVAGGDTAFFDGVQDCYEQFMPGTPAGLRLQPAADIPSNDWGTEAADEFDAPVHRRWVQVTEYSTQTYFDLLRSFSTHIALSPENRAALFACIEERIERDYGGRVRRATLTELCVARRRAD